MLQNLGLNGSLWGVIIPQVAFALPTTIIILVPFLRAIPRGARGCREDRRREPPRLLLAHPAAAVDPGLVTVGVLAFVASWNAYLLPLFVLGAGGADQANFTLPLGVQVYSTQYSSDTAGVLAFTSLAMIPALVFFLLAERRIVGGLTGAVKG